MSSRFVCLSLAAFGLALLLPLTRAQQPATNFASPTTASPTSSLQDATSQLIADAIKLMNANDVNGSLDKLNQAIKLNPSIAGSYVLRASIYCDQKQWPQAEADFKTAAQLDPKNVVIKLNLIEIKFLQKRYDEARAGFVSIESDPDMGDFAAYKVFLCDMMGGHDALAAKELDAFNQVGSKPSYYYSNAAWSLYHKNIEDARGWLVSAGHIYAPRKNLYYSRSLKDLGFLPLPAPPEK